MTLKTSSLQKGLVLHLPLDKESLQSATVFADKTPYENVGTSANAAGFVPDRMGQADRAMSFNGIDDYVDCGNDDSLDFGTGDFSLSVWIYLTGIFINTYPAIMGKGDTGNNEWMLRIRPVGIDNYLELYSSDRIATTQEMPLLNVWKHCVFVRNGDDGYIYVDSIQEGYSSGIAAKNFTTTKTIRIGNADGSVNRYFNGSIADVRIYDRALSPEEVTALYEQYRPKVKIVAGKPKLLV
jgi:hypothetical protein